MTSLINPANTWLVWAAIVAVAAFGTWSETYKLGRIVSGAVVSIFLGLALSNLGVIPTEAPVYDTIITYLLPLAIPLILFQADLRRIAQQAGRLLIGFTGAVAGTVTGGIVAFSIIPIGVEAPEIAAGFTAAYIGGNLNLVATANAIEMASSDSLAATIAAANIAVFLYLMGMFAANNLTWLAAWLGNGETPLSSPPLATAPAKAEPLQLLASLTIGTLICAIGFAVQDYSGWPGTAILCITFMSVTLATVFPKFFATLDCAGALGFVLLQIFFAAIGAQASVSAVIEFGPVLMLFAGVMLSIHFLFVLVTARLFSLRLDEALVASNACALGAPTAAVMALSLRREELALPGFLCGTLGYALGTFVGIGMYNFLQ